MLYRIVLGAVAYLVGAGALTWWLGSVFKRERATLGLPVEHLRAAEAWYASHAGVAILDDDQLAELALLVAASGRRSA
jgi:hypothetical protein